MSDLIDYLVAVALGFWIGFLFNSFSSESILEKEAIERGYAEHDRITGEWQWIEKEGE